MGISGSQKALMQARAGIARAGATRSNYVRPVFGVLINGVDRTSKIAKGTTRVQQNYNGVPWTCTFSLIENPGFVPQANQQVIVGFGSTTWNRVFKGHIIRVRHQRKKGVVQYHITCTDRTRVFDNKLVVKGYKNKRADEIARDIITNYCPGFTADHVQWNLPVIADFPVINEKPSQVLSRLVRTMGSGGAYIDPYDAVHLFNTVGETGPRAFSPPLPITDNLVLTDMFEYEDDSSTQRTQDVLEGKRTQCPIGTPDGATVTVITASGTVEYLVVAGGGAGGSTRQGGGGAGGVKTGTMVLTAGTYTVTVGTGGVASNGNNSVFHTVTATGGGRGGINGSSGGSGGGSGVSGGVPQAGGAGTAGEGNNGGAGDFSLNPAGGGGGGAGAAGNSAGPNTGGKGGDGISSSISGSPANYGGGGGGNGDSGSGAGGLGGGGNGGAGGSPGTAGAANTGGGGGGGGSYDGGSGIVIIRYPTGALSATGGTVTTAGGYTIHTFLSGSSSLVVSNIVVVSPPPVVTDLPLEDAVQLDTAGGTVRVGTQVVDYSSLKGPLSPGKNPPGSALTADVALFATSLPVADVSVFTDTSGWVKVGDQIVRYSSKGASSLDGIPTSGFGSLGAAVKVDTSVTWLASMVLTTPTIFDPALAPSTDVVQRTTVTNVTAQTTLASQEGSDGLKQDLIEDDRLSLSGLITRGQGDVSAVGAPLVVAQWVTRDMNARPAAAQIITRTTPDALNTTVIITQVTITMKYGPNMPPERQCQGSLVRLPQIIDVAVTDKK